MSAYPNDEIKRKVDAVLNELGLKSQKGNCFWSASPKAGAKHTLEGGFENYPVITPAMALYIECQLNARVEYNTFGTVGNQHVIINLL